MGRMFSKTVAIAAGAQFLGTEFSAMVAKQGKLLQVRGIYLKMGSEAKSWQIGKTVSYARPSSGAAPGTPTVFHTLFQSIADGAFGTSTGTDVAINGSDVEGLRLLQGQQIQIRSGTNTAPAGTNASAAMQATIEYEELDNSESVRP